MDRYNLIDVIAAEPDIEWVKYDDAMAEIATLKADLEASRESMLSAITYTKKHDADVIRTMVDRLIDPINNKDVAETISVGSIIAIEDYADNLEKNIDNV